MGVGRGVSVAAKTSERAGVRLGMGLGPWFVGILSDFLMPTMGTESLRYALCVAVLVNLWAGIHYLLGARSVRGDLLETEAMNAKLA